MTVRELLDALRAAPPDATVWLQVVSWEHGTVLMWDTKHNYTLTHINIRPQIVILHHDDPPSNSAR